MTSHTDPTVTGRLQRWLSSLARRPPVDSGGIARLERRYIYILPTAAGILLGVVLMLMLLGSLNYQNNPALLLTFLMTSVVVLSMLHTWLNLLDLRVVSMGGPSVFAGQDAVFNFTMENDRMRPRRDLGMCIGNQRTKPVDMDPQASCPVSISLPTTHRGRVSAGVKLETRFPLGLFRAWSYLRSDVPVVVYPRPASRSPSSISVPIVKNNDQGEMGAGTDDFVGPRDYRAGDSLRFLDWKALAREQGLVVKQFGGDRAAQIWIDWDRFPAVETELRLSLLCRQVLEATEQGLSYGLRLPGSTIAPGHGEIHKHRCLEVLADFDHG
jgi:uncharacterized protein (DUF58 family)